MKLTVATPCHDSFKPHTVVSLVHLIGAQKVPVRFDVAQGSFIHQNREKLMERAVSVGSTHLCFIDTDMVFPSDTIDRLARVKKDIVGVNANLKTHPPVSTVKRLDQAPGTLVELTETEPFEVRAVGTGIMLIDLSKTKELPRPWFAISEDENGPVGEDVYFCDLARKNGLEVWCDPTIPVQHVGDYLY